MTYVSKCIFHEIIIKKSGGYDEGENKNQMHSVNSNFMHSDNAYSEL